MKATNRIIAVGLLLATSASVASADNPVVTITNVETAVLDPVNWDKGFPGERYFDAVRPMLVRFPGAAETILAKLREGYVVEKAELVLNWEKQEGAGPERGRAGWGSETE